MSDCLRSVVLALLLSLAQAGCATTDIAPSDNRPEELPVEKSEPQPPQAISRLAAETGTATWYGPGLEGRATASGQRFTGQGLTAAHKSLPFGTRVRVTALDTLSSVVVTINDRLPAASRHIIDLSQAAGKMLKMIGTGIARVRIEILD